MGRGGRGWFQEQACEKKTEESLVCKVASLDECMLVIQQHKPSTSHLPNVIPDAREGVEERSVGSRVPIHCQLCNSSTQILWVHTIYSVVTQSEVNARYRQVIHAVRREE